jgi:hypothetical protein
MGAVGVQAAWVNRPAGWETTHGMQQTSTLPQHTQESRTVVQPSSSPNGSREELAVRVLPPPLGGGSERCAAHARRSMNACGPNAVLKSGDSNDDASKRPPNSGQPVLQDADQEEEPTWCWCDPGFRIRDRPLKQCLPKSLEVLGGGDNTVGAETAAALMSAVFHVSSRSGCECAVDQYADAATLAYAHSRSQLADPTPHAALGGVAPWPTRVSGDANTLHQPWVDASQPTPTITLLVSHFPMQSSHLHAHYGEIEAAMRANLLNPALTELYVVSYKRLA